MKQPHVPAAKLKGNLSNCYKIKLVKAGYRLVYNVIDSKLIIYIVAVGHRNQEKAYEKAAQRI